ncbi:MAG: DUF58 domain-containing protein [Syntrophorhabdaceae bacterium]|nr:DUF58 domain-containing protein [Syntrophorhabdaceae bacterium]
MIKITKAGFLYIGLTIFLGVSAVNTGNNLMYLIVAALLSFMGISGFFGKNNLSKISIDIEFPGEIYANAPSLIKVTLKNEKKLLPAFLINLHIGEKKILFPYVETKGGLTQYITTLWKKRGEYKIEDIYISSVFPFNFFTRFKKVKKGFTVVVFPQLIKSDVFTIQRRERRTKGEQADNRIGFDSDIVSIREYTIGDPIKYINWKATAKTGKLKTKEFSSLMDKPRIIDFDSISIKDVETKISCIAYTILQCIKKNLPVGLKLKDRFYEPDCSQKHKINMMRELALYNNVER